MISNYEPDLPEIIALLKKLIPYAKDRNLIIALENHDRFKASDLKRIIEDTDPEVSWYLSWTQPIRLVQVKE